MRLAVLSDIHGNLTALESVLEDLNAVGSVDQVWVLGDLAAFGSRPLECIQRVQGLSETFGKDNVRVIRGNTDRYLVTGERPRTEPTKEEADFKNPARHFQDRDSALNWGVNQLNFAEYDYLRQLHGETHLTVPDYGIVLGYHGTPGDDEGDLRPETPDESARDAVLDREGRLGIGAHIHLQMDRDVRGWRLVNIGSVGMSFDNPGFAQWGLFTFENGDVHVDLRNLPYDVEAAVRDLEAQGYPTLEYAANRLRHGNRS